jgi:hypothetical protein
MRRIPKARYTEPSFHATADSGVALEDSFCEAGGCMPSVLKLASDGSIQWQREYFGLERAGADSIFAFPDGGYLLSGSTSLWERWSTSIPWTLKASAGGEPEEGQIHLTGSIGGGRGRPAAFQMGDSNYLYWSSFSGFVHLDIQGRGIRQDFVVPELAGEVVRFPWSTGPISTWSAIESQGWTHLDRSRIASRKTWASWKPLQGTSLTSPWTNLLSWPARRSSSLKARM